MADDTGVEAEGPLEIGIGAGKKNKGAQVWHQFSAALDQTEAITAFELITSHQHPSLVLHHCLQGLRFGGAGTYE